MSNNANFTLLSDVKPQLVAWLWKDRIPLGELSLFNGDPATNKSSVTLDLAARVSTGKAMPDGSEGVLGGVLLLQAEDSLRKTVVPRLLAAAQYRGRIAQLPETVTIPKDLDAIEKAVIGMQAKLLVIDPLSVFLGRNANNDQSVRQALAPLAEMAERQKIAVILIRHLNKTSGQRTMYRGLGSIGIVAAARSRFLFGVSPKDPNMRVLVHTKSNLGVLAPSLLYEPVGDDNGVVHIEWRGETDYTTEDLVAAKHGQRSRDEAKQFLHKLLGNGPVAQKDVQAKAAHEGLAWRTIERAKADLKIISDHQGFGQGSSFYWSLPKDGYTPPTHSLAVYDGPEDHTPPTTEVAVYDKKTEREAAADQQANASVQAGGCADMGLIPENQADNNPVAAPHADDGEWKASALTTAAYRNADGTCSNCGYPADGPPPMRPRKKRR